MAWFRVFTLAAAASLTLALLSPACRNEQVPADEASLGSTRAGLALAVAGFVETTVIDGLDDPTVVRFAANGRVLVAEKGGRVLSYDNLADTTPTLLLDLSAQVHDFWDRGLLGMAIDPAFSSQPYLYVLYAYDADVGGDPPTWGDTCPTPPGATADGCVISGRLSRFEVTGNSAGSETVLVEGWRQQYPSHATGQVEFGPDGALYASGGDGASFNFVDYGQDGNPINPLGDPPVAVGQAQTPPGAQGGALRSQSPRRSSGPTLLNGTIIRVDPETGLGKADNPWSASSDPNAQRIVSYGLRNPFRIAAHPSKAELWVADVGWDEWEELNRLPLGAASVANFGWPCYEGAGKQAGYDAADLALCESLYATAEHVTPFFAYHHSAGVSSNDGCGRGSSSVTGLTFYTGTNYPPAYQGAMFFADYSRRCIYSMQPAANGEPDPASARSFHVDADGPVFLTTGPGGDLFYAALGSGTIQRVSYLRPVAAFTAAPAAGQVPLIVSFDAASSLEPLPDDVLTFAWDLDGDGEFDDSSDVQPAFLYETVGSYAVRVRVTDPRGVSDVSAPLTIKASSEPPEVSSPPEPFIDTPSIELRWQAGEVIEFSGHASDAEDGELPASALSWQIVIQHCPGGCHVHDLLSFDAVASGSFVAEDHDYPMHLELILTATDSSGQKRTARRSLEPSTVSLVFDTQPSNLELVVGASAQTTPFVRRVIAGSENSVSATETQTVDGVSWRFQSWSDGLPRSHQLPSATAPARYVAVYAASGGLTGQYFDELAFSGASLTRIDPVIDFDWASASPAAALGADTFSVRFTGDVKVDFAETYRFATLSDDGVRLAIDGLTVIDHFEDQGPTLHRGSLALTPGWHAIVLEYFENTGGAELELRWSSPSQTEQVIPESHLRPGCGSELSCGLGLSCSSESTCVPACDPGTCAGSKHCRLNGSATCVGLCASLECPQGDVCQAGLCVDACASVTCGEDQHCELGLCVDHEPHGGGGEGGGGGQASGDGGAAGALHDGGAAGALHDGGAAGALHDGGAAGALHDGGAAGALHDGGAAGALHDGGAAGALHDGGAAGAPHDGGAAGTDGGVPPAEGSAGQASGGAPSEQAGAAGAAVSDPAQPSGGCSCAAADRKPAPIWLGPLLGLLLLGRRRARDKRAAEA